jgi:cytidylate kinase
MAVVTLSRQLGSHGEEIATGVAQTLGLRLIDAETINQAAQKAGVPQVALAELEHEGERGVANQVLKALGTMPNLRSISPFGVSPASEAAPARSEVSNLAVPFSGLFSPTIPPISASLESYVRMVGLVIRGLAHEGNVLIVGRGGQALLKSHPDALHVQIVAPQPQRLEVVMARLGLDRRAAQNRTRASDRARADYVRRYHDADWLDSTLYHLVINTGRVPVVTSMDLVIAAQRAMIDAPDRDNRDEKDHTTQT